MKLTAIILAAVLIFPMSENKSISEDSQWHVKIGEKVPEFDFTFKDYTTAKISDYEGKVVLLNFFATWCPPCRAELPRVQQEIWEVYRDNPEFALFVFGREEDWDKLDPFIESTGYTFPILPDLERRIFSKFAEQSIPRNVVLDREGKIIYQSIGYSETEFNELLEVLKEAL